MNWFKKLKVGQKLIISFFLMIIIMVTICIGGFWGLQHVESNLQEIFSVRMPGMDYLIEADRDLQQLLVAERSMIFANAKSDIFKQLVADYKENLQQSTTRWDKYKALATTEAEKAIIPKYEEARAVWQGISRRVVEGRIADTRAGRREALDLTLSQALEKFEAMRNYLDQLTEITLKQAQTAENNAHRIYRRAQILLAGLAGFGTLAGIFLIWSLGRSVTLPLRRMIAGLTAASNQVAAASGQVASSSQALAEGSSEQAASIEETSSSLEEMASMTRQNADNATQADSLMNEASQIVGRANSSMENLAVAMDEISAANQETQNIVKTIDGIAFQTNLLALNAAVEAARAGEAGAGFAVVADEVRNLALRAAEAAKNTAAIIDGTVSRTQEGTKLTGDTRQAFAEVRGSAEKVGALVAEIASASKEQAQGIDQINTAVNEMDKVVQANAASAEESASASQEMTAQAGEMKRFVTELEEMVGHVDGKTHERQNALSSDASASYSRPKTGALGSRRDDIPSGNERTSSRDAMRTGLAGLKTPGKKDPKKMIPLDEDDFQDF